MFGSTRWSPFEEVLNFQREVDRVFSQYWNDLPTRTAATLPSSSFQVNRTADAWRIDIPLPGIDPKQVKLEVAGNTLSIRAEHAEGEADGRLLYEQTLTVPQFLDLEKISAAHRHGLLQLTLPVRESVKPRQIQIENASSDKKQLTAV